MPIPYNVSQKLETEKKKHILTDPICTIINPVSETGKVQNHISHEQMQNTQQNISK